MVIDVHTWEFLYREKVGTEPGHVSITPDGKYVYVVDEKKARINVAELGTLQRLGTIVTWPEPHQIAFVKEGQINIKSIAGM